MGTGVIASGDQTQEACEMIRQWLHTNISEEAAEVTRIVYGGSVTEINAPTFAKLPDVDGFLVGSTSTKPIFRTIFELVKLEAQNHTYL
jgi:triosephosphate isomerase (TIM)